MKKTLLVLFAICIALAACTAAPETQTATQTLNPITDTPAATPTDTPIPSPTESTLEVYTPEPRMVVYDFLAELCSARWTNNGEDVTCPGNMDDTGAGYAGYLDDPIIEGGFHVHVPALLTIPAHNGQYEGIFGIYPPFTMQAGDVFHALVTCEETQPPCGAYYYLAYYDSQGNYHNWPREQGPHRLQNYNGGSGGWIYVDEPLDFLAGQTVRLVLSINDRPGYQGSHALWISPVILRDTTVTPTTEQGSGTISGRIDMSSAPPYLTDPVTGTSIPAVVVFFNLDDGTYEWILTTYTHPYFEITLKTGNYHVVAYARGVGGLPYVSAGYTGQNPSCNQPLAIVYLTPDAEIEDLVIADWNWTCNGTALRPEKPADAPVP